MIESINEDNRDSLAYPLSFEIVFPSNPCGIGDIFYSPFLGSEIVGFLSELFTKSTQEHFVHPE